MKNNNNSTPRREYGILWLFLAMLILGSLGALFKDYVGERFGYLGFWVWSGVTAVFLLYGLGYFAQYLLPPSANNHWSDGFTLLLRSYTSAVNLVLNPIATMRRPRQTDPRRSTLSDSFRIISAGLTQSHEVATLSQGERITRAAGPGLVILYRREQVASLIDLRPQKFSKEIKANSRDGIPVETNVSITFRIRQNEPEFGLENEIYPYDPDAVFLVSRFNSVDDNGRIQTWTHQLGPRAVALVVQEISNYTLDQLQQSGLPPLAINEIRRKVLQNLRMEAENNGIELMSVGISTLQFPKDIMQQRIKNWESKWQREIMIKRAEGEAEGERQIKQVRARAQIEMIERITQSIDAMRRQENANLNEIITLRMIEALEEAMSDGSVQALLPQQVMTRLVTEASQQLQRWVGQPGEDGRL